MKTIIICSGSFSYNAYFKDIILSSDYIICADGGSRHTYAMKIEPDVIIGDLDSMTKECYDFYSELNVKIIKFSSDKDKTDTQICIEYALNFSSEIILLGATGNRIDHMLANISLLKLGLDKNRIIKIIDDNNEIYLIDKELKIKGIKGDFISLLPISEKVDGISITGAYYELNNAEMVIGNPYGVSNYFIEEEVNVKMKKGLLLVIKSHD